MESYRRLAVLILKAQERNSSATVLWNNTAGLMTDAVAKDLGVFIDNKLNFEKHINYCINKANRVMGIVRKTFDFLDQESFLYLFKGLVRPHLEYASSVWSPYLLKHIEALEAVQRRATKLIPGFSHLSYGERLTRLKLPTLAYRRTRGDMIQVFKITHPEIGYDEQVCTNFFEDTITPHLRGHSKNCF